MESELKTVKKSKKWQILTLSLALIAIIGGGILFLSGLANQTKDNTFALDSEYYGQTGETSLDAETVDELLDEKKSFILITYLPTCTNNIIAFMNDYSVAHEVSYHYINWTNFRETSLKETVKFSPSVVLIKEGTIVDFLDANSNDYIPEYSNYTDFETWLNQYIIYE